MSELLDDAVELGYLIGQSYRGKGYAQECGRAILAYAEEVLDLEELHVLIDRTNDTSLHVAQKLGFGHMDRTRFMEQRQQKIQKHP